MRYRSGHSWGVPLLLAVLGACAASPTASPPVTAKPPAWRTASFFTFGPRVSLIAGAATAGLAAAGPSGWLPLTRSTFAFGAFGQPGMTFPIAPATGSDTASNPSPPKPPIPPFLYGGLGYGTLGYGGLGYGTTPIIAILGNRHQDIATETSAEHGGSEQGPTGGAAAK